MESNEAEENLQTKPEGKEEAELSAREDAETLGRAGGADQSVGHIVHFANTFVLYQRKN